MTDDDICGEEKNNGEECTYSPKYPDGKCGHHTKHDTGADNPEGRPTKLTYERQEGIASMVEEGRSINSAARVHNISVPTIYNWLDRGESEYKEGNENIFAEFFQRITRAKGYGEEWYFNTVVEIAKEEGDHRFLASLMKQRYPDSWGETDTGVDADTVTIEVSEDVAQTWPEQ